MHRFLNFGSEVAASTLMTNNAVLSSWKKEILLEVLGASSYYKNKKGQIDVYSNLCFSNAASAHCLSDLKKSTDSFRLSSFSLGLFPGVELFLSFQIELIITVSNDRTETETEKSHHSK